jgi:general nucleoside transport system ATP-binding protein
MSEASTSEPSSRTEAPGRDPAGVPRLALAGVTKRYPGVTANDRIDLAVAPGEIHAVLGENGAGKSTLMKIIYGAVRPDEGELFWDGERVRVDSPAAARRRGIAMVFQHFALFETLTVAENVWLGQDTGSSRAEVGARLVAVARDHELDISPERVVHDLSVGERQRVEILRALLTEPRLLILDEPTSVLTPQAIERLFATLRRIAAGGCSILYISHKLDEVRALCERCTVLRAGRVTGVVDPRAESTQRLAERMLGAVPPSVVGRAPRTGEVALEVRGLSLPRRFEKVSRTGEQPGASLVDVNLTVRAGEVLGIAGISGNGQADLLAALSGEDRRAPPGTIRLFDKDVSRAQVRQRRAQGLRYIPEERMGHGAVPNLSLAGNALLTRDELVTRGGWLRRGAAWRLVTRLLERGGVTAEGPDARAASLSGGNLQKFIVGREIDADPKVLVVAQPTWGLDVGATARIRAELMALADRGCAVLVVSEDLEELFEISTALVVMARGRLSPRVPVAEASIAQIGAWMGATGGAWS